MGFRSGLKGGGGLFNGDGTLRPFTFSAIAPGSKKPGDWAYIVLAFQPDGSEKINTQHLFLGGVKQYEFEEGEGTAYSLNDKTGERQPKSRIGKKTPAGLFFQTLYAAGDKAKIDFDTVLPDLDAGEPLNFDAIDGLRVRLGQEVDVKGTAEIGKRKGSDGNEYDRTNTVVEAAYELPSAKSTKGGNAKGKGSSADTSVRDAADTVVLQLIADAKKADKKNRTGVVPSSRVNKMAVLRNTEIDKGIKSAVEKLIITTEYLNEAAERGVFSYDTSDETVSEAA